MELEGEVIVGVLGQWASGKSTAAKTLVGYLGGQGNVAFINDQWLFAGQVTDYLFKLEASKVVSGLEDDGRQRLSGERAIVWLRPGEHLRTVDLTRLQFDVPEDTLADWLNSARAELALQVCDGCAEGKPMVIEAGFGQNPADHTITDLLLRLEEAGVEPKQVKWIIVEAGYDIRSERNKKRRGGPPADLFARYAMDGGDLEPDDQRRLEEQGTVILRVPNDHDDIERFKADIIAAFEEICAGVLPETTVNGKCEQA
jgi:hypothetical protein